MLQSLQVDPWEGRLKTGEIKIVESNRNVKCQLCLVKITQCKSVLKSEQKLINYFDFESQESTGHLGRNLLFAISPYPLLCFSLLSSDKLLTTRNSKINH